jgi:hypothetical protein
MTATTDTDRKAAPRRVIKQVEVLRHWVGSERASEAEREAARHRLAILLSRYVVPGVNDFETVTARVNDGERYLYNPGAWMGAKYAETRTMSLPEIAKLMREEIKLARKLAKKVAPTDGETGELAVIDPLGDAPASIKISIRSAYFSGGGSIDVRISGIPEEWGWTYGENHYGDRIKIATPACLALYNEVKRIHSQYNYDNSDTQTDYFDTRFYGHVDTDERIVFERW